MNQHSGKDTEVVSTTEINPTRIVTVKAAPSEQVLKFNAHCIVLLFHAQTVGYCVERQCMVRFMRGE